MKIYLQLKRKIEYVNRHRRSTKPKFTAYTMCGEVAGPYGRHGAIFKGLQLGGAMIACVFGGKCSHYNEETG